MADKYYTPSTGKYTDKDPLYVNLNLVVTGSPEFKAIGIVKTWKQLLKMEKFRSEIKAIIYKGTSKHSAILPNDETLLRTVYKKWDLILKNRPTEKRGVKSGFKWSEERKQKLRDMYAAKKGKVI